MKKLPTNEKRPFAEHVHELRGRLFIVVTTLITASSAGYFIHDRLLHILQKPLNQTLFYTSPTGGINFVFKLCFLFGFLFTIPVLVYQLSKFLAPVIKRKTNHMFVSIMCWSSFMALAGIVFAYYVSLPGALKFLTNFGGQDIKSLITADEYFNFAMAYLLGYALLFQLPLIVLFINRIKPLKPSKMLKVQRYIIVGSFIVAALLTPTPDPLNQAIMASPAIVFYQLSIFMVAIINRSKKSKTKPSFTIQTAPSPVKLPRYLVAEPNTPPVAVAVRSPKRQFQDVVAVKKAQATELRPAQARKTSEQTAAKLFTSNRPVMDMVIKPQGQTAVQ